MKELNFNQLEIDEMSSKERYFSIIESLLFVSGEPLKLLHIATLIECDVEFTEKILEELMEKYNKNERGIKIICMNENYQLVTKPENSNFVEKLLKTNVRQSLSQAALETLAITAYKQPVTRIEIDEIRGVKSDRALTTLTERNLIKESGRKEVPGRPIIYATTEEFLKYFGIDNIKELPNIDNFIAEEIAIEKEEEE